MFSIKQKVQLYSQLIMKQSMIPRPATYLYQAPFIWQQKKHIFDDLHSASLISLGRQCNEDCIYVLDENYIHIIKIIQSFSKEN